MRYEMGERHVTALQQMRLIVGFLGERAQNGWWPTAFYEPSSRLFLEPIYPKTMALAQYHGVLEAARLVHDEHLSVGSYHLFRLPEELEQDLHASMQSGEGPELAGQLLQSQDGASEALRSMFKAAPPAGAGPIAVGSIGDLGSFDALRAMAGIYAAAFLQGTRAYPYLVG